MDQHLKARPYTAWQLIRMYWQSDERLSAYVLFSTVILFTVILVLLELVFTTWLNYFYDALQDYDTRGVLDLLVMFCFLAGVMIVFSVYRYYLQQFLCLRWRRWLTSEFINRWLKNRSYYYLENFDEKTDNPDQRIQEDVNSLVGNSMLLTVGIISSIVTIMVFVYVLWKLSGVFQMPLGSFGTLNIHGYLVWVSIIYCFFGTWITFKIGRPLISLIFEQQRREANFRFSAIDLRTHSENIALYRGEHNQKNILQKIFYGVLENWYAIILRQKIILWFTAGFNQMAVILPLVAALPNYFRGVFKLGGLIQAMRAFALIQDAFSFLINSYTTIAEWRAVIRRLLTFLDHMYELDVSAKKHNKFSCVPSKANKISVKNLMINTPQGTQLLENINQEFQHGKSYVIKGPSGIGKSTFIRTLAGIWPYGAGEISLPSKKNILFFPQTSYMPLGTLQEALVFPNKMSNVSDEKLKKLLIDCDLHNLTDQLHEVCRWSERLSPGELQRISFVRILLHKPDWAFLDEITSSLDLAREKHLYSLLKKQLPHCSIVSVGHRPSLDNYHDVEIDLKQYSVQSGSEFVH